MPTPRKGKAKVKVTASGKKVSYGQAGKAKGGGARVKPGTSKSVHHTLLDPSVVCHSPPLPRTSRAS